MCLGHSKNAFGGPTSDGNDAKEKSPEPKDASSAFTWSILNGTTYLVVHNDKLFEYPFIYVKHYPSLFLAVVIDTGCGQKNSRADHDQTTSLQELILAKLQPEEDLQTHQDLDFMILCTHCHFDHIGGLASFSASQAAIVASSNDEDFLAPGANRDRNSLCQAFGMQTPEYTISHYAEDQEYLTYKDHVLGLQVLHTPGHTPDSMAIWDESEKYLYVGDTCYKRSVTLPWGEKQDVPIVFPIQGNWQHWLQSMSRLLDFVRTKTRGFRPGDARLGAGHTTCDADAFELLYNAYHFGLRVQDGKVPVIVRTPGDQVAPGGSLGDEMFVLWSEEGEDGFSLCAPESLGIEKEKGAEMTKAEKWEAEQE